MFLYVLSTFTDNDAVSSAPDNTSKNDTRRTLKRHCAAVVDDPVVVNLHTLSVKDALIEVNAKLKTHRFSEVYGAQFKS